MQSKTDYLSKPQHILYRANTILKRPSIIAIRPPVLVPQIRSKHSQGFGVSEALVISRILSIILRRICKDERPRIPPPSNDKIRGYGGVMFTLSIHVH